MDSLARALACSPELFPHSLDLRSDTVGFVRLGNTDYRDASFLDDRILGPRTIRRSMSCDEVAHAVAEAALPESCHFIFHIGHVGSTLLSRLVGAQAGTLSLREPAILRTLAQLCGEPLLASPSWGQDGFERRLGTFLKLWSRTFHPGDRAVLKATSFVSELAAKLLSRPSSPKTLLMFVRPESYLATILGGANAPQEAMALAPSRRKRLRSRAGDEIYDLTKLGIGEIVAMSWACEMTALGEAAGQVRERAMAIDFDAFLVEPYSALTQVFHHLEIPASGRDIETILRGPEMRRYSKAPQYEYDAKLRREVLDQARTTSGEEIRRGLAWLDRISREHKSVRQAMSAAAGGKWSG